MRYILTRYWYFLLFALFALLARLNENNQIFRSAFTPHHKQFNKNLIEKENLLGVYLDSIWSVGLEDDFLNYFSGHKGEFRGLMNTHGIAFYVFQNERLKYWTDNSIVLPDSILRMPDGFTQFENAFGEKRSRINDTLAIFGVIQIKYNYSYQNEFIQNKYHSSCKLSPSILISEQEVENSFPIYDDSGKLLFYLSESDDSIAKKEDQLTFVFLFLTVFFLILYLRRIQLKVDFTVRYYIIFAMVLIGLRVSLQWFQFPHLLYEYSLFTSEPFALSKVFPSLGELLISSSLWAYLVFVFYSKIKLNETFKIRHVEYLSIVVWGLLIAFSSINLLYIVKSLVHSGNYQMEMFRLTDLSFFSLVAYLIIGLNIFAHFLLLDKAIKNFRTSLSLRQVHLFYLLVILILSFYVLISDTGYPFVSLMLVLFIFLFFAIRQYKGKNELSTLIWTLVFCSVYITVNVTQLSSEKRLEQSKVKAVSLSTERDPIGELLMGEAISLIKADDVVVHYIDSVWFDYDGLLKHLDTKYFVGYLSKYDLQLTVCNARDSLIFDNTEEQLFHCYDFFADLIDQNGRETSIEHLYLLQTEKGDVEYFLEVPLYSPKAKEDINLFISLVSKPNFEVLGYPELLIDNSVKQTSSFSGVSYATYFDNRLIKQTGDFPYAFARNYYGFSDVEFAHFKKNKHHHVLFNTMDNHTIIVSHPIVQPFNLLISFTYLFFFLLFLISLLLFFGQGYFQLLNVPLTIKNKIALSMISVFVVSLFGVGAAVMVYSYRQFEANKSASLTEKIQSVLVELEHKIDYVDEIHEVPQEYINSLLVKFSNVFFTDINLYDVSGKLVASSRNEIFDRKLTSSYLNSYAFREVLLEKSARFVQEEHIGELNYYAAYIPFRNSENKIIAYLNLPYFSKEKVLRENLQRVFIAVLNILVILIVLSSILAVYISGRLTKPLRMVQQKLRGIDLNHTNETINYKGKDEIAELVAEYNRMLEALSISAQMLAKNERELAWRQMAKQIAHEIKNPLTPMKLNVQLLERAWENEDADFEERFKKASASLIEQIDSLSAIATSFSQFAQISDSKHKRVDIVERVNSSALTFTNYKKVSINVKTEQNEIFVKADADQLLQVFNNLFKNAIQAIPKEKQGEVNVDIDLEAESVIVSITDNGIGISKEMQDKLFVPNFTTKTGGTGLGLAIVKKIVEEFNGSIWINSKVDEGSTFYVSLPVSKK